MTMHSKFGAAVALVTALGAASGLVVGYLNVRPAVGTAMIGIVIGTGIARGMFSTASKSQK
jgi:hypothetical protein